MRQVFSHGDSLTSHLWLCSICQQHRASKHFYRALAVLILTSLGRRLLPRPTQQHTVTHTVVSIVGWGLLSRDTLSIFKFPEGKRDVAGGFFSPSFIILSSPSLHLIKTPQDIQPKPAASLWPLAKPCLWSSDPLIIHLNVPHGTLLIQGRQRFTSHAGHSPQALGVPVCKPSCRSDGFISSESCHFTLWRAGTVIIMHCKLKLLLYQSITQNLRNVL